MGRSQSKYTADIRGLDLGLERIATSGGIIPLTTEWHGAVPAEFRIAKKIFIIRIPTEYSNNDLYVQTNVEMCWLSLKFSFIHGVNMLIMK